MLYNQALNLETASAPDRALTIELHVRFINAQNALENDISTQAYVTKLAQNEAAEAQRIRTQRVTELSKPRTVNEPGQRVGGGVTPPRLVTKREPEYAPEARALKIEGKVVLQVTVDVDGSARDIQLKQGLGFGLDEAAATAVSQWRFAPGARGGEPVPVLATIEVNFRLL